MKLCIQLISVYALVAIFILSIGLTNKIPAQDNRELIDEICLRQKEIRDTIVLVQTHHSGGSGTIIGYLETDLNNVLEYLILTNAHITRTRFIVVIENIDSLTGKIDIEKIDTGCKVIVFDHQNRDYHKYDVDVIAEDTNRDLSLLSLKTARKLAVARLADNIMLEQVRVFDDVFAVGCQLGNIPIPTAGIITQILINNDDLEQFIVYGHTAQVAPGSSGGGLFKKYNDHYYMIGIPFCVETLTNGQIIPHLAYAISMKTAKNFINQNMVNYP